MGLELLMVQNQHVIKIVENLASEKSNCAEIDKVLSNLFSQEGH